MTNIHLAGYPETGNLPSPPPPGKEILKVYLVLPYRYPVPVLHRYRTV
jgi:hypothetical protein